MGQVILLSRFRTYSGGSTSNVDPSALSAISRPLGGGDTIEDFGDILASQIATGLYSVELTDDEYVDGEQYEVYSTATVAGHTVYGITEFQFRALPGDTPPIEADLAVVNDGDGDAVTATVSNGEAGVTYTLLYRVSADADWTEGETREGDGDIAQAGLDNATWYEMVVVGTLGGLKGNPSNPVGVYVTDGAAAATGDIALTMENLRTLLAQSTTFQAWVGATGLEAERIAAAKARAHLGGYSIGRESEYPTDAQKKAAWQAARPFAIINPTEDLRHTSRASGKYDFAGSLYLYFEADVADEDDTDFEGPLVEIGNTLDAIRREMLTLAGTNGYLRIRDLALIVPPERAERKLRTVQGDHQAAAYRVEIG